MTKEEIIKAYNNVWEKAKEIYNKEPFASFPRPSVVFESKSTTAGRAWRDGSKVCFNTTLARTNSEEFISTIIHEVSHIVQYRFYPKSQPHGKEFKMIDRSLGNTGRTYHNYDISALPNRHAFKCGCKTHYVSTQIKNKIVFGGQRRWCKLCKGDLKKV